jgi:hypothetical protein
MFDFKVAEMMLKERGNGKRNDWCSLLELRKEI